MNLYSPITAFHLAMWRNAGTWCGGTRTLEQCMKGQPKSGWAELLWSKR